MKLLKSASDAVLGLLVPKAEAGACCSSQGYCKNVACNKYMHQRCCLNCRCEWVCTMCEWN